MAFPTGQDKHGRQPKQEKIASVPVDDRTESQIGGDQVEADNRGQQTQNPNPRPTSNHPSLCGTMNPPSRPRQVVEIDLENLQPAVLQKLLLLWAARAFGDEVFHAEDRYYEVHFGKHHIHIPIRPGVEHLPFPAAEAQLAGTGPLTREAATAFRPSKAQRKILAFLKGGKRLGYTDLEEHVGRYWTDRVDRSCAPERRFGGYQEMMQLGLLDQDGAGGLYFLSEVGEAAAEEFCSEDDD